MRTRLVGTLVRCASVSCLLAASLGAQEILVPFESVWLYTKGTKAPPTEWKETTFEPPSASWFEGKAPIGYGETVIATELADMQNAGGRPGYASVFLRYTFTVDDPFPFQSLMLRVLYDDGYVAFLNGTYVTKSSNMASTNPPYNTLATAGHEMALEDFNISQHIGRLKVGENVLAVQVHNDALTSSDVVFDAQLEATLKTNPFACVASPTCVDRGDGVVALAWTKPAGGTIEKIEVREGDVVVLTVPGTQSSAELRDVPSGDHFYRFFGKNGSTECYGGGCSISVGAVQQFRRGDVSDDGRINILDPMFLAHYLFQSGEVPTCLDTGDINDDGMLNVSDIRLLLGYLFDRGPPPSTPGPLACGADSALDTLAKCQYGHCP